MRSKESGPSNPRTDLITKMSGSKQHDDTLFYAVDLSGGEDVLRHQTHVIMASEQGGSHYQGKMWRPRLLGHKQIWRHFWLSSRWYDTIMLIT